METHKNFYTAKEVHSLVFGEQISLTTLHKLIREGKIPTVVFCRKKLIPAGWVKKTIALADQITD